MSESVLERYFDNAATSPLDTHVFNAMLPWLKENWGNAHSLHSIGREAHEAVNRARGYIASLLGADDPSQIFFTSGASEANQWVLRAYLHSAEPGRVAVSPFEHNSMRELAVQAGAAVLKNDQYEVEPLFGAAFTSVMTVNNEMGAILHPSAFKKSSLAVHTDLTQAAGKLPISLENVDFASLSAHKFYGPKGVGVLYSRSFPPEPLILGEHEQGSRGGTLNVPAIVGAGEAARIAIGEMERDLRIAQELRQIVLDELSGTKDMFLLGGSNISPYILCLCFADIHGESLVIEMDRLGYAISAGAACSSNSTEPSHVLQALNIEPRFAKGAIRISFGRYNSKVCARKLAQNLKQSAQMLRTIK